MTYFGPALDPPLGGSGRKTTTLVKDLGCSIKMYIVIEFIQDNGHLAENLKKKVSLCFIYILCREKGMDLSYTHRKFQKAT